MRGERGFTMPAAVFFSFFIIAFLVHQANILMLEKKFYKEAEELLLLDIIMNRAVRDVKRAIHESGELKEEYIYENGTASVAVSNMDSSVIFILIECKTTQNRTYKVSFQYNRDNQQIQNWTEER
ncbi:MAG: competence type IV pilus minor pilin ComGG [Ectobacillus sp.]